jgi:hypothetical protein
MTGYQSKKTAAQAKLQCQCSMTTKLVGSGCQYCNPEYLYDDDAQPAQEPESECNPQDLCAGCRCKYAAQPEQEPMAYLPPTPSPENALYTAPQRTWVGLDELQKERLVLLICNNQELHELRELVDEIEAQLKEKNT